MTTVIMMMMMMMMTWRLRLTMLPRLVVHYAVVQPVNSSLCVHTMQLNPGPWNLQKHQAFGRTA